ncbi:protein KRTCAP2 [Tanacetum coccineum]
MVALEAAPDWPATQPLMPRTALETPRLVVAVVVPSSRLDLAMAESGNSMLYSLLLFIVTLSLQEMYRGKLASSELFTILGGFTSSLVFLFLLTFIGNYQETSGVKTGWGAVILAEVVALIAAGTVHREPWLQKVNQKDEGTEEGGFSDLMTPTPVFVLIIDANPDDVLQRCFRLCSKCSSDIVLLIRSLYVHRVAFLTGIVTVLILQF